MDIQTSAQLTGIKAIDFEEHKFLNLYVMVAVKGGVGSKTAKFKLPDLGRASEVEKYIGQECLISGYLEENDKQETFVIVTDIKVAQKKPN